MAAAPHDDVVVDGDVQKTAGLGDAVGDLDVGAARVGDPEQVDEFALLIRFLPANADNARALPG